MLSLHKFPRHKHIQNCNGFCMFPLQIPDVPNVRATVLPGVSVIHPANAVRRSRVPPSGGTLNLSDSGGQTTSVGMVGEVQDNNAIHHVLY